MDSTIGKTYNIPELLTFSSSSSLFLSRAATFVNKQNL